jgi:hypothetical protein
VAATAVEAAPGARGIPVGTFDEPNWVQPTFQAWTRSALLWVTFPADVELVETTKIVTDLLPHRPETVR